MAMRFTRAAQATSVVCLSDPDVTFTEPEGSDEPTYSDHDWIPVGTVGLLVAPAATVVTYRSLTHSEVLTINVCDDRSLQATTLAVQSVTGWPVPSEALPMMDLAPRMSLGRCIIAASVLAPDPLDQPA